MSCKIVFAVPGMPGTAEPEPTFQEVPAMECAFTHKVVHVGSPGCGKCSFLGRISKSECDLFEIDTGESVNGAVYWSCTSPQASVLDVHRS